MRKNLDGTGPANRCYRRQLNGVTKSGYYSPYIELRKAKLSLFRPNGLCERGSCHIARLTSCWIALFRHCHNHAIEVYIQLPFTGW